jgi:hypothetical protein
MRIKKIKHNVMHWTLINSEDQTQNTTMWLARVLEIALFMKPSSDKG